MEKEAYHYKKNGLEFGEDARQVTDTIKLLELMEQDYQGARKQLENLGQVLSVREAQVSQRIHFARLSSNTNSSLCLMSYQTNTTRNQLGTARLGVIEQSNLIPGPTRLEIHCLDGFQVNCNEDKVEHWESIKAKSLLQYLLTKPRKSIAKEELMEALWPDCDPKVSSNNLKAAMHGLRQTFNKVLDVEPDIPHVTFNQGTYRINPRIQLWLDVEQFELYWETGRRLQIEGGQDEAIKKFQAAEELYKDDYLSDDPYEEWTLLRREALRDIYLNVLGKLADFYMQKADYECCIMYCFKILNKDSCREDAYQRIMRCYYHSGLRNRALQWYVICCKAIKQQLATEPDPATTCLYRQILNNQTI